MTDLAHTYAAIIPHHQQRRVLMMGGGADDKPVLPHITSGKYIDWNVVEFNAALHERFGLTATTLRRLRVDFNRETKVEQAVFLVETHPPIPPTADGMRWVDFHDPILAAPEDPALRGWLIEQTTGKIPKRRAPWAQPGWFAQTSEWVSDQLVGLGIKPTGPPVQRRNWALTAMIVQPTEVGDVYVKATNTMFGPEGETTRLLGSIYPDHIPQVLALDSARCLILMRDFGGVRLEDAPGDDPNEAHFEAVVRLYARIQREMAARIDDLLRLGCWDRRPERLAGMVDDLLADTAPMPIDKPGGLTSDEHRRLLALGPRLKALCAELAGYRIPPSLVHGDFHGVNIAICDDGRPLYFDWSDAQVGHPFIDIVTLFEEHGNAPHGPGWGDFTTRMQSVYLEAWSEFEPPDRLQQALALAAPLAVLNMAVSYRHIFHHTEEAARSELGGATAFWLKKLFEMMPEK